MTSLQAYERFLIKLNRTDSNANVNVPKGKFVVIYNEQKNRWLKEKLKKKLSTDELDELRELLVDDAQLQFDKKHYNYVDFKLPEDFFHFSSSYTVASKGDCKGRILDNWNTKGLDIRLLLRDPNNKPSFEYEETLISFGNRKVKVYFDGFTVNKVYLNYYKSPSEIDIEGYINSLNEPSANKNPDISDWLVDEIINRCVLEVTRNVEDGEGVQFAKNRVDTEE